MRRTTLAALLTAVVATAASVAAVATPATARSNMPAHGSASATILLAKATGAQEVPGPGDEDGRGHFAAVVKGRTLCYLLTARRIAEPAAAHIHVGAEGVAGGIVVGLRAPADGLVTDCLKAVPDEDAEPMQLSQSELAAILADPSGYYVNVHNAGFPMGAIRGQLR